MNSKLAKKEQLFIIVVILLLLGLLAGGYFLLISPKMAQVEMKDKELQSQEQLLSVLQTKEAPTSSVTIESAASLQKQIPVKPLTEQLLLDIEKAEVASGSFVSNMQFSEGDVQGQAAPEEQNTQQNAEGTTNQTNTDTTETNNNQSASSLPTGLKKVTVDLTIESSDYPELEKFITELEQSERIIAVETIDFTANDETISDDQTDKILTSQVKVSAFYMPALTDLIDQLPKLETPEPANKKNPFSFFGNYAPDRVEGNGYSITNDPPQNQENTSDTDTLEPPSIPELPNVSETPDAANENTNSTTDNQTETGNIVEKDGKQYKVTNYKVKPGDTFYELAIKYYDNSKGFKLIMDWNHMQIPRRLLAGTTIEIPIPVDGEI